MDVIFLDFDGVINNWNHFDGVDPKNVLILKRIIEITGAKIVATTSNKYKFQNRNINMTETSYYNYILKLSELGISIYDVTPFVEKDKEKEILAYLKEHKEIRNFVIIDDEHVSNILKDHEVILENYDGLLEEHIIPIISILRGNLGIYPKNFDTNESFEQRWIKINALKQKRKV